MFSNFNLNCIGMNGSRKYCLSCILINCLTKRLNLYSTPDPSQAYLYIYALIFWNIYYFVTCRNMYHVEMFILDNFIWMFQNIITLRHLRFCVSLWLSHVSYRGVLPLKNINIQTNMQFWDLSLSYFVWVGWVKTICFILQMQKRVKRII